MSIASLSRKSFADARSLREPLKHERFVRPFLRASHRGRGDDGAVSGHRGAKTWDVKAF